jgi:uncharacterized protein (DUF1810 family)
MKDFYDLNRFVEAQEGVYEDVIAELQRGVKAGHWMWFVFPQINGLGISERAQKFSIESINEATAYAQHILLGPRLRECTQLVINIEGRLIQQILGHPDYLKFRSSMTLFAHATQDSQIFQDALAKYFDGKRDTMTLDILR